MALADSASKKWDILVEQLIALCALNKLPKGNDAFTKLLDEEPQLKNLNSQLFASLCYFILGIITYEEREKLIKWPLINIQTCTKFRKGVTSIVTSLQETHPWANLKKLPESYFMNPHGYQPRVVDFLLSLSNLAIHVALNDPELLFMHSGEGINPSDVTTMRQIISNATKKEENIISQNVLSLKEFEDAKNNICNKCIALKQMNDDLQHELNKLTANIASEGIVQCGKNVDIKEIKQIREDKLEELKSINEELHKYYHLSIDLKTKIQALETKVILSAKDFGCHDSPLNLTKATSKACGDLYQLFECLTSKNTTKDKENNFYEKLVIAKKSLISEKEAFVSFLSKMSSLKI